MTKRVRPCILSNFLLLVKQQPSSPLSFVVEMAFGIPKQCKMFRYSLTGVSISQLNKNLAHNIQNFEIKFNC